MMKKDSKNQQAKILELMRRLPQPGKILIDSLKNGISGLSLRLKSIPKELARDYYSSHQINLQLVKNGAPFGENPLFLRTSSDEWLDWINKKPIFTIKEEDVGKEIGTVEERVRNFNKNILDEFLNRFSPVIKISGECQERILDEDNYPLYFWDKPICVSGSYRSSNIHSIQVTIDGLGSQSTIDSKNLYFEYWKILPDEKKLLMRSVIKWHKALLSFLHLVERDNIEIPIDFVKLEKICWDEINALM